MHLGIIRANTHEKSVKETVSENIKKARRTLYSLMTTGLHGENGLNPDTSIHILKTYVIPVLLYGLEILLPEKSNLQLLETYTRKIMKQILSLSTTTPDPVVYILSGLIPIEGQIHIKALTFLNSICLQDDTCVEKTIIKKTNFAEY